MTEKVKMVRGSGNVFLDIGFEPGKAQNLQLRSELMSRIESFVTSSGLTQKECAARMGVTQPRLSDLLKGKIDKFSIDALVNMLGHAGMRVKLTGPIGLWHRKPKRGSVDHDSVHDKT